MHANKTADFITVGEELDRRKRLDAVGGLAYITSLANESVSYNVEEHAKIISEKAQLRRLIDAGNKIVGMTYAGADEPSRNDLRMFLYIVGHRFIGKRCNISKTTYRIESLATV